MTVIFSKSVIPPSFSKGYRHQDCVKTRFRWVLAYKMHELRLWFLFDVLHFTLRLHFLGYPTVTTVMSVIAVIAVHVRHRLSIIDVVDRHIKKYHKM